MANLSFSLVMVIHLWVVCVSSTPEECTNYTPIDHHFRGADNGFGPWCDFEDTTLNWQPWYRIKAGQWYRFTYPGEEMVPLATPGMAKCWTYRSGWQNYDNPTSLFETTTGDMCFHYHSPCYHTAAARTTLCWGYYVYSLDVDFEICDAAFCTTAYDGPTTFPTSAPTSDPTIQPTPTPSVQPTVHPTPQPTFQPTVQPTPEPTTAEPTFQPTTQAPTLAPTYAPTEAWKLPMWATVVLAIVLTCCCCCFCCCLMCLRRRNKKLNAQTAAPATTKSFLQAKKLSESAHFQQIVPVTIKSLKEANDKEQSISEGATLGWDAAPPSGSEGASPACDAPPPSDEQQSLSEGETESVVLL